MTWIGCYERGSLGSMASLASSTAACARECPGFSYIALGSQGWCTCVTNYPTPPRYKRQVPDVRCGQVCKGEGELVPTRYCGDFSTSAIYWINKSATHHVVASDKVAEKGGHLAAPSPGDTSKAASSEEAGAGASLRPDADANAEASSRRQKKILKGISYTPMPLQEETRHLPQDDFATKRTAVLWGPKGRGDLAVMRSLGANAVRLYGNDIDADHKPFLDEAQAQGLHVIGGISDRPYLSVDGGCAATNHDCSRQTKEQYLKMLKTGFLLANKTYHPAVRSLVVMNEPDVKFSPISEHWRWCKAVVSAVDGILEAERLAGVQGPRPNLTAALSFSFCGSCKRFANSPAVGQMVELRQAFESPDEVGYKPKNHLGHMYRERFENSVNTKNPAEGKQGVRHLFLEKYHKAFDATPVFLGEYHTPEVSGAPWATKVDLGEDLKTIMAAAEEPSSLLSGLVFHEFQVRYDKGGEQLAFGLFGLGDRENASVKIDGERFTSWCLVPMGLPREVQRCGLTEDGVNYQTPSTWFFHMEDVPTPSLCCAKCTELPRCKSWTWLEDAGLDGCGGDALDLPAGRRLAGGLRMARAPCCDVLEVVANNKTCGERIAGLVKSEGSTFSTARRKVAADYPEACGVCAEASTSRCWLKNALPHGKEAMAGAVSGLPVPVPKPEDLEPLMPVVVAEAFGGPGLASDDPRLCRASRVQFLAPKSLFG